MNASPDTEPNSRTTTLASTQATRPTAPTPPAQTVSAPLPPTQSREDTDAGWGEYRERDDDDRLLRDRPPHWDNA